MNKSRRPIRALSVGLVAGLLVVSSGAAQAVSITEGFDDVALPGWTKTNLSSPVGSTGWFQGNPAVFPSQAGATNSYIGANFNNTTGSGDISNWLITPMQTTLSSTDTLSFWTRTPTASPFPDRLEVRVSTNGACSPGATAASVGDFTTLLTSVNPTLAVGGYPETWTQITTPLTGVVGDATGCIALRYFVTLGGPTGDNSNYIGIDTFSYTDVGGDTTAPIVTINSGPNGKTSNAKPTFGFSANEASTFACRVFAQGSTPGAFAPCSGPGSTHTPAANLNDGPFTIEVRGTDASANAGTATRNFQVTAAACAAAKASVTDSQAALDKANKKLKKAKAKLKKVKKNGTAAQIKKAKAKVKKAKAKVKAAKAALATAQAAVTSNCV